MKIAIVAAGFTPAEADKLRRAMATFKRVGTIGTFQRKMIDGMLAQRLRARLRRALLPPDRGLRRIRLPGEPRRELRAPRLRLGLAQVPLPGRLRRRAAQRAADGLLRAGADRARRARARRRGARARRQSFGLGFDAGARAARRRTPARPAPRHARRPARDPRHPPRPARDQGPERGRCEADRRAARRDYNSVRDVWLRTGLSPRVLERLADADAFGSLGLTRREALWAAKALGRVGDRDDDLPLFTNSADDAAPHIVSREPDVALPPMPLGEEVVNDYRFLRLSLRAHPAQFLRADLAARGIAPQRGAARARQQHARHHLRPGHLPAAAGLGQGRGVHDHRGRERGRQRHRLAEGVRARAPGGARRALRRGHRPRAVGIRRHPRRRRPARGSHLLAGAAGRPGRRHRRSRARRRGAPAGRGPARGRTRLAAATACCG